MDNVINVDDFSKYMAKPEKPNISQEDMKTLLKAKEIAERGLTAEIKKDVKNDCLKVYEVRKIKK